MRFKMLLLLLFVIIISIRGQAISQEKPIPIATGEWLPYVSESASDPGIFREILDKVFKLNGARNLIFLIL